MDSYPKQPRNGAHSVMSGHVSNPAEGLTGGGLRTEGAGTGKGSKVPPPAPVMQQFSYGRNSSKAKMVKFLNRAQWPPARLTGTPGSCAGLSRKQGLTWCDRWSSQHSWAEWPWQDMSTAPGMPPCHRCGGCWPTAAVSTTQPQAGSAWPLKDRRICGWLPVSEPHALPLVIPQQPRNAHV